MVGNKCNAEAVFNKDRICPKSVKKARFFIAGGRWSLPFGPVKRVGGCSDSSDFAESWRDRGFQTIFSSTSASRAGG